jgi:hypothetical protein
MAIRPPARRRRVARRRQRRLPDEAVGLIAGALITVMLLRVLVSMAGVERWTTTWRVLNVLSGIVFWPLERAGLTGPVLVGTLRAGDAIVASAIVVLGLYLLASRAVIPNRP